MKKYSLLLFLFVIAFSNCEKDDICVEATTPMLIIKFYDYTNPENSKLVNSLTVWANEKDNLYNNEQLDSIVIPLNLNENYTLYKFQSGSDIDSVNIAYERKDIFVSRSCGYKTVFENLTIETTDTWIKDYLINNSTIENETNTHINIYH